MALLCALCFTACADGSAETTAPEGGVEVPAVTNGAAEDGATVEKTGVWENAVYLKDTELGEGEKTVLVEVKAGEQSVTFTVNTDETTLGAALLEHNIIAGEDGPYGLYIKVVNGITADYDVDQSYWGFYKNGEYMMTGVDVTEFADGEHYELVYTK